MKNPKKHCLELKCPKCGHQLRRLPRGRPGNVGDKGNLPQEALVYWRLGEAEWDYAYKQALPDSAYAYVEPGCESEACRHLPFKNKQDEIDRPHLAAALQALKGARSGKPVPYAAKAKPKLCAAAKSVGMKSTVCGTAESLEEEDAKIKELFRPPYGDTPAHPDDVNKRFAKSIDSPTMKRSPSQLQATPGGKPGANKPFHTPVVEKMSRAEHEAIVNKMKADHKEEMRTLQDELREAAAREKAKDRKISDQSQELAKYKRIASKESKKDAMMKQQTEDLAECQQSNEEKDLELSTKDDIISLEKSQKETLQDELKDAKDFINKLEAKNKRLNTEKSDESIKRARAVQEAIEAKKETARYQDETANLVEETTDLQRQLSEKSSQRLGDIKKLQKQETTITNLTEQLVEKDKELQKKDKSLHKAIIEIKKAGKLLANAGYRRVKE